MLCLPATAPAAAAPVTWCGTDQATTDRQPDATNGLQWHVVYAFPADGADNFAARASAIATDLASIDAWWAGQDPSRRIRFDLHAFPNCAPGFGQLDISRVQLPNGAGHYVPLSTRLERLTFDLNAAPFAFTSSDKKYLVYYDAPSIEGPETCGQGYSGVIDGGRNSYAAVYLGACNQNPGDGEGDAAITAVHELTHALGAVDPKAPNVCPPPNQGHVCPASADLLYFEGVAGDTLSSRILDVNRDDYYGHSGTWWDIQDSLFLSRVGTPDVAAPTGPNSFNVTSEGATVHLSWPGAADDVGPVTYRVYKDGELVETIAETKVSDRLAVGQIVSYGLRAVDPTGLLGPALAVRFKVGYGIVDEGGALVRDTVAPPRVTGLRGKATKAGLRLRWNAAKDPGGIKGYIVERNGKRYRLITKTAISIPLAKSRARWSVRAVDRAGNIGRRPLAARS